MLIQSVLCESLMLMSSQSSSREMFPEVHVPGVVPIVPFLLFPSNSSKMVVFSVLLIFLSEFQP